jgi:hypothetical protein
MAVEHIPLDLRLLVADCVHSLEPRSREKGIRLSAEIPPEFPTRLIGDPLRLRQILNNLLSNAVKFTEVGSVVVRLGGGQAGVSSRFDLELQVADTGPGIPPEKLSLIFEKFTQADGSISRRYGGTGLGLAITSRLVEMQGGEIRVESAVGRGSTFLVELPLELAPQDTAAASSLPAWGDNLVDRAQADGMSVLFVQLSPARREKLRTAADGAGEAGILAADGLATAQISECARPIRQAAASKDLEAVRADLVRLESGIDDLEGKPAPTHASAATG